MTDFLPKILLLFLSFLLISVFILENDNHFFKNVILCDIIIKILKEEKYG